MTLTNASSMESTFCKRKNVDQRVVFLGYVFHITKNSLTVSITCVSMSIYIVFRIADTA